MEKHTEVMTPIPLVELMSRMSCEMKGPLAEKSNKQQDQPHQQWLKC